MIAHFAPILMFALVFVCLLLGYPVAITLAGTALITAGIGILTGVFDSALLLATPSRLYGIMVNQTLIAVPLFVLMGVILEKSRIAEDLLDSMSKLFAGVPGGLAVSVTLVGMLMAASTGIVGATVVTMGLMSLPSMLKNGYDPRLATGTICATGTLGQIIPPSIALVLLGDVLSNAYQQAQLSIGIFSPKTVSVGDLFAGAMIPGMILVFCYLTFIISLAMLKPELAPAVKRTSDFRLGETLASIAPTLLLIIAVLGSILTGVATPTEAAGVGAMGALILAASRKYLDASHKVLRLSEFRSIAQSTLKTTSMVFFILIGASLFSLVFRGYGGDDLVRSLFDALPGGVFSATLVVMLVIFLLGFILDFIEIIFVVIPIVGPVLLTMGVDPIWLGIMIAINLQTSFLTPPFGFALFYLRGVTPASVSTQKIYLGVIPYILLQIVVLIIIALWPALATWLPNKLY